jgi:hypothetical protein
VAFLAGRRCPNAGGPESLPLETGIARSVAWFNEWRETHPEEDTVLELDGSELAPKESAHFFKP